MGSLDDRRGRRRRLSAEEAELWQRVTAAAKPLRRGRRPPAADLPAADEAARAADNDRQPTPPDADRAAVAPPPAPPPRRPQRELGHGVAPGLDKRTLSKLRRGQIRIEAEIDLHGRTQDEAHRALLAFLAAAQASGRRCVRVITGRGLRGDGTTGVLRRSVPIWLNQPGNRERILAFCYATPADGGEGALYVLLRRRRG